MVEGICSPVCQASRKEDRRNQRTIVDLLRDYPWPGNIRELQNVIERAVIVADTNTLSVDERWLVRQRVVEPDAKTPLGDELTDHERARVEAALAASKGRVSGPTGAAARLGIPRLTLESKIRSLKLTSTASEATKRSDSPAILARYSRRQTSPDPKSSRNAGFYEGIMRLGTWIFVLSNRLPGPISKRFRNTSASQN